MFGYPTLYRRSFDKVQAKKLNKNYVHDIPIELRSETGELIPFTDVGRTYVTLLFEKN